MCKEKCENCECKKFKDVFRIEKCNVFFLENGNVEALMYKVYQSKDGIEDYCYIDSIDNIQEMLSKDLDKLEDIPILKPIWIKKEDYLKLPIFKGY